MLSLCLVTQKGGTGKSSMAINLAVLAEAEGVKTCLIDLDPQGTVAEWYDARTASTPAVVTGRDIGDLQEALERLAHAGFALAIIDTPGTDAHSTRIAMAAASFCLIPLRPSKADLNATIPTIAALRDMGRRFAFVLNQAPPNKQARLTLAVSKRLETDAPIAPVALAARLDNQYAYALGQGVTEYAPSSKAAEEVQELWQWCCKQLRIGHDQEQKRSA
jgi:chromosome partitioning protein